MREKTPTPRSGREQSIALAAYGAHAQLDRGGAHRPRTIPNKKRQAEKRSCRTWR